MQAWSENIFELGYAWPIPHRCHTLNIKLVLVWFFEARNPKPVWYSYGENLRKATIQMQLCIEVFHDVHDLSHLLLDLYAKNIYVVVHIRQNIFITHPHIHLIFLLHTCGQNYLGCRYLILIPLLITVTTHLSNTNSIKMCWCILQHKISIILRA